MTRAEWLRRAVPPLRRMIRAHHPLDRRVFVRCGLTGTGPLKSNTEGLTDLPSDAVAVIEIADRVRGGRLALEVLLHEMIHAALPRHVHDHGPEFRALARKVGFRSPFQESPPGPKLKRELVALARSLGPLPPAGS